MIQPPTSIALVEGLKSSTTSAPASGPLGFDSISLITMVEAVAIAWLEANNDEERITATKIKRNFLLNHDYED